MSRSISAGFVTLIKMKLRRAPPAVLWLATTAVVATTTWAEDAPNIEIKVAPVSAAVQAALRNAGEAGRSPAHKLKPQTEVSWRFGGNSGGFVLVNAVSGRETSCVIYMRQGQSLRPLGGAANCRWTKNLVPRLMRMQDRVWIEFPSHRWQGPIPQAAAGELKAYFNKDTGGICLVGAPQHGYDDLRCPDDEAPASK